MIPITYPSNIDPRNMTKKFKMASSNPIRPDSLTLTVVLMSKAIR